MLLRSLINNLLPPIFKNWFIFCSEIQNYDTVLSSADKLFKTSYRDDSYGKNKLDMTHREIFAGIYFCEFGYQWIFCEDLFLRILILSMFYIF